MFRGVWNSLSQFNVLEIGICLPVMKGTFMGLNILYLKIIKWKGIWPMISRRVQKIASSLTWSSWVTGQF